jgi:hypothetical protein
MQFYSGPLMHFLSGVDTPIVRSVRTLVGGIYSVDTGKILAWSG